MKLGIISDTHDHFENIIKSLDIFKRHEVSYVLHLGDFISPNAVKAFNGVRLIGIFGNNDGDTYRLMQESHAIQGDIKGDFYAFHQDNLHIACYHGSELDIKNALVQCGTYDVVIYGHTHEYEDRIEGNTRVLNPGTAHGFGDNATIMIFDTLAGEAKAVKIL